MRFLLFEYYQQPLATAGSEYTRKEREGYIQHVYYVGVLWGYANLFFPPGAPELHSLLLSPPPNLCHVQTVRLVRL